MYKILVVEDTLSVREEICDIMSMEGYSVIQAENGEIGYKMALKESPDLIVSDILMPVLGGLEMFEKLQENTKTMNIPLIFLSAKADKEDIRAGMNLGAEDYLTKPINTDDLVRSVENKIKKKLIRDLKNSDSAKQLQNTILNQKIQLENYSKLILKGLKPSQTEISVSDLLAWTKKELEKNNNFVDSNIMINEKWRSLEQVESNTLNSNKIADRVINRIDETPHITISIKNELPTLLANENMLEKVFEVLIQNALDHINRRMGLIELGCETTEKEYVFSVKYDYVRLYPTKNQKTPEGIHVIKPAKSIGVELNIVEKIISHYKGKLYVNIVHNEGTTIYFSLPKININQYNIH